MKKKRILRIGFVILGTTLLLIGIFALLGVFNKMLVFGVELRRSTYESMGINLSIAGAIFAAIGLFYRAESR